MKDAINFDEIDELGPQDYDATFTDITIGDVNRDEVAAVGAVHIDAHAENGGDVDYVVDGSVQFAADYHCSRCLEP